LVKTVRATTSFHKYRKLADEKPYSQVDREYKSTDEQLSTRPIETESNKIETIHKAGRK
jgi:hypothetical protein